MRNSLWVKWRFASMASCIVDAKRELLSSEGKGIPGGRDRSSFDAEFCCSVMAQLLFGTKQ